jgi:hypothetical protein
MHERKSVCVLVDALDESSDRKTLPAIIKTLCQSGQINTLIISRNEEDINSTLTGLIDYVVPIKDEHVDVDIQLHIQQCLRTDQIHSSWPDDLKSTTESTLVTRAHGM